MYSYLDAMFTSPTHVEIDFRKTFNAVIIVILVEFFVDDNIDQEKKVEQAILYTHSTLHHRAPISNHAIIALTAPLAKKKAHSHLRTPRQGISNKSAPNHLFSALLAISWSIRGGMVQDKGQLKPNRT